MKRLTHDDTGDIGMGTEVGSQPLLHVEWRLLVHRLPGPAPSHHRLYMWKSVLA